MSTLNLLTVTGPDWPSVYAFKQSLKFKGSAVVGRTLKVERLGPGDTSGGVYDAPVLAIKRSYVKKTMTIAYRTFGAPYDWLKKASCDFPTLVFTNQWVDDGRMGVMVARMGTLPVVWSQEVVEVEVGVEDEGEPEADVLINRVGLRASWKEAAKRVRACGGWWGRKDIRSLPWK